MRKKALITGITGQDGSYLAELLLSKGYEVHGMARRSSVDNHLHRIKHLINNKNFHIESGDLTDFESVLNIIKSVKPDEIYNLAAQSQVHVSFKQPKLTEAVNYSGLENILNIAWQISRGIRIYQASTSEMFGDTTVTPQNEKIALNPCSPYAKAKVRAHLLCQNYRKLGQYVSCGILFNHESPRRGVEFVTRKVCDKVAEMKKGESNVLVLGNINAKRDWGHAKDYVEAMWLMLQQDKPDDYVVATGKTRSIKELIDAAFNNAGLTYTYVDLTEFSEEDADLRIKMLSNSKKNNNYVVSHPRFYRPVEVNSLCGDASKAKAELGWSPKISFDELIKEMYEAALRK